MLKIPRLLVRRRCGSLVTRLIAVETRSEIPLCREIHASPTLQSAPEKVAPVNSIRSRWNFKDLKEDVEYHRQNIANRKSDADIDAVVRLHNEYLHQLKLAEEIRHRRKQISQIVKKSSKEEILKLKEEGKALKEQEKDLDAKVASLFEEVERHALRIPNRTHPDSPIGSEEEGSRVIQEVGEKPEFAFEIRDHVELGKSLDLFDFETASEVTGSKFVYLKNEAALLEFALSMWALDKLRRRGWTVVLPPDLARHQIVEGCGFQPRDVESSQVYSIERSDLCLAGTSEITLAGMKAGHIIPAEDLPIRLAAFSHCFRMEAGSAGRESRGLYRLHQFSKVEMFAFGTESQSDLLHEEMLDLEIEMYKELGIHFKVVEMPSEDLGAPAYRKFDILAWMPAKAVYGEISSTSNCTDYQARRLNIRYRRANAPVAKNRSQDKQTHFVHTVNGTAVAIPRLLLTILEMGQQEDGSVVIPEVLRPYVGNQEKILPKGRANL